MKNRRFTKHFGEASLDSSGNSIIVVDNFPKKRRLW